jgi:hypothetical protein
VAEDGNEIGLMQGNLSISAEGSSDIIDAREDIHDYGFGGHGFWLQGPGIRLVNNISAGSSGPGFTYFTTTTKNLFDAVNLADPSLAAGHVAVPVSSIPIAQFTGNTAYTAPIGLDVWHNLMSMTDGQSYIDGFTAWNIRLLGIKLFYVGHMTIRNATLLGQESTYPGTGVFSNRFVHDLTVENAYISGFEVGIDAPVLRSTVVRGAYISAVRPFFIEKGHDTIRTVDISGSIIIPTLTAAQLQGRQQHHVYMTGAYDFTKGYPVVAGLMHADLVRYAPTGGPSLQLYYLEQLASAVPFLMQSDPPAIPPEYVGKTNAQLWQAYGVAFGGEAIDPATAIVSPFYNGLIRPIL